MYFSHCMAYELTGQHLKKVTQPHPPPGNPPGNPLAIPLPPITPYTNPTNNQQHQHLALYLTEL